MATTQNTFNGTGSNLGPFSFTFKWLESTDIKVTVGGVLKTAGTHYNLQGLNYTTKTGGQVLFTAGNAPPTGTNNIRIYRDTDDAELSATFSSGSAIRAKDLNDNFTQNLYVTQEVNNNSVNIDGSNTMVGNLDMGGYRVINNGVPTNDNDAVTKKYVDDRTGNVTIPGHTYWRYVAVGGETTLTGPGTGTGTLQYSATREQVFLNGALQQRTVDYTANNGTSITFNVALTAGDVVDVRCVNNLASGNTGLADDIVYDNQFTGQVSRSVATKLSDIVSVKDFGAVGDGITDDTEAIGAAITAAVASDITVFCPNGIYKTTGLSSALINERLYGFGVVNNDDDRLGLVWRIGRPDFSPFRTYDGAGGLSIGGDTGSRLWTADPGWAFITPERKGNPGNLTVESMPIMGFGTTVTGTTTNNIRYGHPSLGVVGSPITDFIDDDHICFGNASYKLASKTSTHLTLTNTDGSPLTFSSNQLADIWQAYQETNIRVSISGLEATVLKENGYEMPIYAFPGVLNNDRIYLVINGTKYDIANIDEAVDTSTAWYKYLLTTGPANGTYDATLRCAWLKTSNVQNKHMKGFGSEMSFEAISTPKAYYLRSNYGRQGLYRPVYLSTGSNSIYLDIARGGVSTTGGTSSSATVSGTTLTVGGTITGIFAVGQAVYGDGIGTGTTITALGTGTGGAGTYTLSASYTISSPIIVYTEKGIGNNSVIFTNNDTSSALSQIVSSGTAGAAKILVRDDNPVTSTAGGTSYVTAQRWAAFFGGTGARALDITSINDFNGFNIQGYQASATNPFSLQGLGGNLLIGTRTNRSAQTGAQFGYQIMPVTDNSYTVGNATYRWSTIYAGTGTINTSDAREKTFLDINDAERAAALEIKANLRKFKWNDAIAAKGDGARIHFGASAQQVGEIMRRHGLDPERYGFFCFDSWDEVSDESGTVVQQAGDRYGIRYEELLAFVIAAL